MKGSRGGAGYEGIKGRSWVCRDLGEELGCRDQGEELGMQGSRGGAGYEGDLGREVHLFHYLRFAQKKAHQT